MLVTYEDAGFLVQHSLKPFYKKFSIDPFVVSLSKWREYQKKGSPFLQLISREGRMLFMKDIVTGEAILLKKVCCPWDHRRGKKPKNQ